jgi:hypothetical protein
MLSTQGAGDHCVCVEYLKFETKYLVRFTVKSSLSG